MVNKKIIHILINLALASCDQTLSENYDKELRFLALKSLCMLAGIYNRFVNSFLVFLKESIYSR